MIITLGFTESDRDAGYISFSDGYRPGARQQLVTITLEGDGSQYDAEPVEMSPAFAVEAVASAITTIAPSATRSAALPADAATPFLPSRFLLSASTPTGAPHHPSGWLTVALHPPSE